MPATPSANSRNALKGISIVSWDYFLNCWLQIYEGTLPDDGSQEYYDQDLSLLAIECLYTRQRDPQD
jgi:hypothetical protein